MIIGHKELKGLRKKHIGQKIVFCSGCFDLTHAGHALFLEDCKKQGDILVVMVGADEEIVYYKGPERPILNESLRLKMIDFLKPVDYALLTMEAYKTKEQPLSPIETTFKELKPDVYVVNADAFNIPYRQELAEKYSVKMLILDRACPPEFDGVSTSKILSKIQNSSENKRK